MSSVVTAATWLFPETGDSLGILSVDVLIIRAPYLGPSIF